MKQNFTLKSAYKYILMLVVCISCSILISNAQLPEGWPSSNGGGVMSLSIKGETVKVPYYRNRTLGTNRSYIKRAVIAVHGINQWTKTVLEDIKSGASTVGVLDETIIICPVFMEEVDHDYHNCSSAYPYWTSRWKYADLSQNNINGERISSFEVVDEIIDVLLGSNPNLESLVVTGFSAGGQFAQRYAGGGRGIYQVSSDIDVRIMPLAPSSYVYMNNRRLVNGSWRVPSGCSGYDNYAYGLSSNLNSYMSQTGVSQIRTNYRNRRVIHMVGANDTKTNYLDVSCAANLQGSNRVTRARRYMDYLEYYYGSSGSSNKSVKVISGWDHTSDVYKGYTSRTNMFPSLSSLKGGSEINENENHVEFVVEPGVKAYPNPVTNGQLNIELGSDFSSSVIRLISLDGKIVTEIEDNNSYSLQLTTDGLKSGMYILQVNSDSKSENMKINIQ